MSPIFIVALISLMIKHPNADKLSFGSTRGCDSACQKECIEVINKYRVNHQAKKVNFSQYLADQAQKWADGGTFGYDMKSRGKYGQLIEWDVKNEMHNFTTVIKHWHDKERDFDFDSSRSKTGKTLHDFTQIVWKKAREAGCAQSEIFGSRYYVVWMDSDGVVNPNVEAGEENIGSPKKGDLHWFESSVDSSKRKPIHLMPSRFLEETSSTRTFPKPKGQIMSTTGKVQSGQSKPITAPDLSEVQEEQRVLNNNAMLKQYLYQDSLNNVVLNENKETASYHVVPGAKESANWQKGAESLIKLDKKKPISSGEKQSDGMVTFTVDADDEENKETASYHVVPGAKENANWQKGAESLIKLDKKKPISSGEKQSDGMVTFTVDADDDRKDAARFQSLVIQDDDMLTKDEEDYNGTLSSERNGGDELGEGDENKQAAAIQSMMKQEDDMIQNENDEEDEESSGNNSTADTDVSSNDTNRKVSKDLTSKSSKITEKLRGKPTSYYLSGVALNNNPNESASSEPSEKTSTDLTGDNSNHSVQVNEMTNHSSVDHHQQSLNDSSSTNNLNSGKNEYKEAGLTEPNSTATLSQNDKSGSQQVPSNDSMSQSVENEDENRQTEIKMSDTAATSANSGGKTVKLGSTSTVLTSKNGLHMASEPQNGSMARMPNLQSGVQLADVINQAKTKNQEGKIPDDSYAPAISPHSQQPVATMSIAPGGRKNQDLTPVSNSFAQSGQTKGQNISIPSTDANAIPSSTSLSDIHHVTSPAVIRLPSTSSRPIKLIFHVKDMKSKGMSTDESETISAYSPTTAGDDITSKKNDDECHDDTLQCHLWAHHGHCKGIAYAEFMKRHCKATCGYCSLPSVIKESAKHVQTSSLAQDEPCVDEPSYEFSCPRWQAQGYCEKRQKEMYSFCRKTCGFCVPTKSKSRLSSSFHPSLGFMETGANGLRDNSNGNTQAPMISQPFTVSQPKPNLNEILKNKATSTPIFDNQSLNYSSIKPPKEDFTLQNSPEPPNSPSQKALRPFGVSMINKAPTSTFNNRSVNSFSIEPPKENSTLEISPGPSEWSRLKALRPFGSAMVNQNGNLNAKNTNEASVVSTQDFGNETTLGTSGISTIKGNKEKAGLHDPYQPLPKQPDATTNLANITKITEQTELNTPSPPKAHEPDMTNKLKNFIKAPVNVDFQSLSTFKPQLAAASSFAKNFPNQQFSSQYEDKVIENGIKALQHRLQVPLEISAVAKSKAGCGQRLCKEKSKIQQAKTRENIGNRVSGVSPASKSKNNLVSTKGCDASCQQECLSAHNRYRLNHGAKALILDQTLASQAQEWADKKMFKHSPWAGGQGGETIALGSLYPSFTAAVKAWHDEEKDYDWSTGEGQRGMKVNHFTQVVWKGAHLLGCGKTLVNGEPYYIAQMDTPGVIAGVPGFDKSNVGQPKEPDLLWFMNSSPYWKEMQTKDSIPKNIEHRIL